MKFIDRYKDILFPIKRLNNFTTQTSATPVTSMQAQCSYLLRYSLLCKTSAVYTYTGAGHANATI